MTEIRWEDPPESTHGWKWNDRLMPLLDHPKRWAMVAIKPSRIAASSLRGNLHLRKFHIPEGRWEFAYRVVDGEHRVYARYLGPDEGDAS